MPQDRVTQKYTAMLIGLSPHQVHREPWMRRHRTSAEGNDMEQEIPESGLDRRKLIKRAGIVTAGVAAWSTPMVTSLASSAHAAGSVPTTCGNPFVCGDPIVFCNANCLCFKTETGSGRCTENALCAEVARCGPGNPPCPAGSTCSVETCCGDPVCLPNCETPNARRTQVGTGLRAAG